MTPDRSLVDSDAQPQVAANARGYSETYWRCEHRWDVNVHPLPAKLAAVSLPLPDVGAPTCVPVSTGCCVTELRSIFADIVAKTDTSTNHPPRVGTSGFVYVRRPGQLQNLRSPRAEVTLSWLGTILQATLDFFTIVVVSVLLYRHVSLLLETYHEHAPL